MRLYKIEERKGRQGVGWGESIRVNRKDGEGVKASREGVRGGFFDKWLFIGGVRQQKQGRGYLHTHKERKRIYGFFSCLLKMNQ